ncbi:UDP-N-acetylmuramoyl-tripeptide--D-alanyl-D-alanine ligase [Pararhodobacter sp. CCB-MM2]|uniref:UDP-N-acetylmuramoyl-tripeptide--D-alanyl-D- alanine ligase n=1 Tax=Pararhodobacter sp. CCB-MM2 TaxID=1786003 RepID=UPI0008364DE7|nr:UDP-N-acetylmuramoyl-tripeptide--D-alanyl-D-alanine ligase [Pararhodobacter sp. CCB-MM2]
MPLWTHLAAEAATGGTATAPFEVFGLSIDTRTIQKGDLFIALKAARDGHDFVAQAFEKGAAAALVTHVPEGVTGPCLLVDDVLKGLEALAVAARARANAQVIAVTGSVGKTSTKEMLRHILSKQGATHAAEASYNNHWGVPLTLARMRPETEFAVIEIGMNHPGEIAPLVALARPHVALVTIVAAAHLEAFDSIEGIAREKAAIYSALQPFGTAIYNADLPVSPILRDAAEKAGRALGFGMAEGVALHVEDIALTAEGCVVRGVTTAHEDTTPTPFLFKTAAPGRHMAMNAVAALAAAEAAGADWDIACLDIADWRPPAGRGQQEVIRLDPVDDEAFTLIDDAFNANPASLAASLDVLASIQPGPGGRRIAILGDMLELGPEEDALHRAVADQPALAEVAQVHCVGRRMQALHDALPTHRRGLQVLEADDLGAQVHQLVQPGDVVLVKGSKGSYVSRVVDRLRDLDHPTQEEPTRD